MLKRILKKACIVGLAQILIIAILFSIGFASDNHSTEQSKKHELVVGYKKDSITTEGPNTDLLEFGSTADVYETLVRLTPDFQTEPLLATKWEYTGNNTWRFYLRKGVTFHDGQEFTADAVKYTMDKALRPSTTALLNLGKDSVKVVDKYTVDITPTKPNSRVVELLTHVSFGIKGPGSDRGKHPIGTGPFRFVSYEKDEQLVVERNPDYWGESARVEKLIFKFIPDPVTRIMALQSGEVDVIVHVPEEMIPQINKTKGIKVLVSSTAAGHSQIRMRVNGPQKSFHVDDRAVRLAVAYALDRQAIVKAAWEGIGDLNQCELPPGILGRYASQVHGFTFDPDKANELLDKAGWKKGRRGIREKNGEKLVLTLVSGYYWGGSVPRSVPQIIQAQLKRVGIAVEIVDMIDYGLLGAKLTNGFGHMWLGQADQNNADPTMWPAFICHSNRYYGLTFSKVWSPGGEFDRTIEEAIRIPDIAECQRLTAEALHILIDREAVMIPLALNYTILAVREGVEGLTPHPSFYNTVWSQATAK